MRACIPSHGVVHTLVDISGAAFSDGFFEVTSATANGPWVVLTTSSVDSHYEVAALDTVGSYDARTGRPYFASHTISEYCAPGATPYFEDSDCGFNDVTVAANGDFAVEETGEFETLDCPGIAPAYSCSDEAVIEAIHAGDVPRAVILANRPTHERGLTDLAINDHDLSWFENNTFEEVGLTAP